METKALKKKATAVPIRWPWPGSLDALQAAPRHHRLLYENDRVRVLEVRIPRGETVPVHTHRWPAVLHVQRWSEHVRRDKRARWFSIRETRGIAQRLQQRCGANPCLLILWKTSEKPSCLS